MAKQTNQSQIAINLAIMALTMRCLAMVAMVVTAAGRVESAVVNYEFVVEEWSVPPSLARESRPVEELGSFPTFLPGEGPSPPSFPSSFPVPARSCNPFLGPALHRLHRVVDFMRPTATSGKRPQERQTPFKIDDDKRKAAIMVNGQYPGELPYLHSPSPRPT